MKPNLNMAPYPKPCPFCLHTELDHIREIITSNGKRILRIACSLCGCCITFDLPQDVSNAIEVK